MNVCVVGLGHVGLVTAACLARAGHAVVGVDQERSRVECVSAGGSPVPETGLAEMIAEAVGAGRLSVTADLAAAVASTEVTLVCVGTPADPGGSLDYAALEAVCRTIGVAIAEAARFHVVVIRSTVLPGALEGVVEPALAVGRTRCAVAANPEFLREGHAIADSIVSVHQQMTVSSLRFPGVNFDLTYESFRERWRNPQTRASGFWTYIDARDAAAACRLALEAKFTGHEVFIASAPLNCMIQPTKALVKEYLPKGAEIRKVSGTHWSCVDSAKARRVLGFKPQHVWQNYLKDR